MPSSVPDPMPLGLLLAAHDALCEINARNERRGEVLLYALLRAAWPSARAQDQ